MTIWQILYFIIAALIFISGLFVLLRFRAIEPKFKPVYFILSLFGLVCACAIWPAALFAGVAGLFIATLDTKE